MFKFEKLGVTGCPAFAGHDRGGWNSIPLMGGAQSKSLASPHEAGNPVFSIFGDDAIYYGANLKDYFEREFGDWRVRSRPWPNQIKYIPFWSDLVERFAQNRNRPA
jgi:hypothetical protein